MGLFSYEDVITPEYLTEKGFYLFNGVWWRPYAFGTYEDEYDKKHGTATCALLHYKYQHYNGIMIVERENRKEDHYNIVTTGDMEFVLNKYSK